MSKLIKINTLSYFSDFSKNAFIGSVSRDMLQRTKLDKMQSSEH